MANSRDREWERRDLRVWSEEEQALVAPPFEDGGPELHNASTYSNWHCRCGECEEANRAKRRKEELSPQ